MRSFRLPVWFRAVLVGFFLSVISGLALIKSGGVREALASSLLEHVVRGYVPLFEQTMALPRRLPEPADGAYYLNGMLVEYHTMPAPVGPSETLRRFDGAFRQTGYVTRNLNVLGLTTLVAIHPKTKMLLTVRPGRDGAGRPTVRLSQQNLSKLDPKFHAEIPGFPAFPGAHRGVLVRSASGPRTTSLTFTVDDSAEGAADYFERELTARGWRALDPARRMAVQRIEGPILREGPHGIVLRSGTRRA